MGTQPAEVGIDDVERGVLGPAPWSVADLPALAPARGFHALSIIGPGVISLGVSVGSGEWVLGPEHATAIHLIGVRMLLACVAILSLGRYIERTLGVFIWILVALRGPVRAAFANGAVETFARYTIVC